MLAGAALLFCYLRVAGASQANSDGDGLVLQASDMLHGNLLPHGWWDTDVSFITTELPEYMGVTGTFAARILVADRSATDGAAPGVCAPGEPVPGVLGGRWLASDGILLTAVTVPRGCAEPQ